MATMADNVCEFLFRDDIETDAQANALLVDVADRAMRALGIDPRAFDHLAGQPVGYDIAAEYAYGDD